jgi:hypothetical protein
MHDDNFKSSFAYSDTFVGKDKLYTFLRYNFKKGKLLISNLNMEAAGSSENTDKYSCG